MFEEICTVVGFWEMLLFYSYNIKVHICKYTIHVVLLLEFVAAKNKVCIVNRITLQYANRTSIFLVTLPSLDWK